MNLWPEVRLRDLSAVITKGTTPTTLGHPFVQAGVNFVKSESITQQGCIDKTKFAFVSPATHQFLRRSILAVGDVLFSMAGVFIGKTAVVTPDTNSRWKVGTRNLSSRSSLTSSSIFRSSVPMSRFRFEDAIFSLHIKCGRTGGVLCGVGIRIKYGFGGR
jgi:hypothetical protein